MPKISDDQASRPDDDNPEWTDDTFRHARPARDVLRQYIGDEATRDLTGSDDRLARRQSQTLQIDADVVDAYRSEGDDWQARMQRVLREHMPSKSAE